MAPGTRSDAWSPTAAAQTCAGSALDPFGHRIALSDHRGNLLVLGRDGRTLCKAPQLRPLLQLAFIPEVPLLVGCADFGLVVCLEMNGRQVWRDGLAVHCGSLATSGNGERILLACYSDGVRRYSLADGPHGHLTTSSLPSGNALVRWPPGPGRGSVHFSACDSTVVDECWQRTLSNAQQSRWPCLRSGIVRWSLRPTASS